MTIYGNRIDTTSEEEDFNNDKLVLLHTLWRHGERSPIYLFPKKHNHDSGGLDDEEDWLNGLGELTMNGLIQHYKLGRRLRHKYIKKIPFLSKIYDPNEVHIRSTKTHRTIQSARANMVGMFGNVKKYKVKEDPLFEQIQVEIIPEKINQLMHNLNACPRRVELWEYLVRTPEFQRYLNYYKNLFNELSKYAGEEVTYKHLLYEMEDLLRIEVENGYNLTREEKVFEEQVFEANHKIYRFMNGLGLSTYEGIKFDEEIPKTGSGKLLWDIIGNMQEKVNCLLNNTALEECESVLKKKYFVFSGHDSTISSLFAAFGFKHTDFNLDGFPMHASCITIELWMKPDKSTYIRAYYLRRHTPSIEITYDITGCENGCSLDSYVKHQFSRDKMK
uniref:acid phosphatase n=1 Tax=Acrobeloides nanus TaxID=290746 RepID=A0A914C1Q4_9BILA